MKLRALLALTCAILLTGCNAHTFNYSYAQVNAVPEFSFVQGQRIAILPVTINGHPSQKIDAAATAAFAVHLAKMGYQVVEMDQLRLEAKRKGAKLPDTLSVDTYPQIAQATGVQLILRSEVDYMLVPAQAYTGTPIIVLNDAFTTAIVSSGGSNIAGMNGAYIPRAQSMSIIDAATGAVLVRGYVDASIYSMTEQLSQRLEDIIFRAEVF